MAAPLRPEARGPLRREARGPSRARGRLARCGPSPWPVAARGPWPVAARGPWPVAARGPSVAKTRLIAGLWSKSDLWAGQTRGRAANKSCSGHRSNRLDWTGRAPRPTISPAKLAFWQRPGRGLPGGRREGGWCQERRPAPRLTLRAARPTSRFAPGPVWASSHVQSNAGRCTRPARTPEDPCTQSSRPAGSNTASRSAPSSRSSCSTPSAGDADTLDRVLLVADGDQASIGRPLVAGASVSAEVVRQARGDKTISSSTGPRP